MDDATTPPPWRLLHLLDGFVTTQLLYVAAKLDLATVLADGPRSGTEIASAVSADRDALGACPARSGHRRRPVRGG